jgi:hypothetical protein
MEQLTLAQLLSLLGRDREAAHRILSWSTPGAPPISYFSRWLRKHAQLWRGSPPNRGTDATRRPQALGRPASGVLALPPPIAEKLRAACCPLECCALW